MIFISKHLAPNPIEDILSATGCFSLLHHACVPESSAHEGTGISRDASFSSRPQARRLSDSNNYGSGNDGDSGEGGNSDAVRGSTDWKDKSESSEGASAGRERDQGADPLVGSTSANSTDAVVPFEGEQALSGTPAAPVPGAGVEKIDNAGKPNSHKSQRRRNRKIREVEGPRPDLYRTELCSMLRDDPGLHVWYALMVLWVAEWPTYARHGNGGDAYLKYLRGLAENFEVPRHAASQIQCLFADELVCGTPTFFLGGVSVVVYWLTMRISLDVVGRDIHRFQDLITVLKKYKQNQHFMDLVSYTQSSKLPADVSISGFPMLLRTAFEGLAFTFSRRLYIKSDKKSEGKSSKRSEGSMTMSGFYNTYVWQYQLNQVQYWMLMMMASIMKRIVSIRPHAGIMVLKFDSSQAPGMGLARGVHGPDKAAIDSLQRQVAASIEGKLDRSLQRFSTLQFVQGVPMAATSAMRPNVSVTGYLELTHTGTFVDHGIFGMDMETDTLEELKERMRPGNLLVDVSLVDPWTSKPPSEWPDPLQRDVLALTAYTATQLLCAEMQWDPSLGNLGRVEVVYSGFTDVYDSTGGTQQGKAKFDPDVQVLLLRDNQKYVEDAQEEGSKKKIISLMAQEPMQWVQKRVIDPERIQWRGVARLLTDGQMYRKNAFGMGLPPALRRNAEELLKPNVVLIHIVIQGLGHLNGDTLGFDMTASEMASRLVRRCRGIYDPVLLKAVTPFVKVQVKNEQKCVGDMPKWVVLVATSGVALFFIILITLLLYHDKIKLPWWIMCICSSRAPWEESSSATSFSNVFTPEVLDKPSKSTRDIIAFAPPIKETTSSLPS
ncbi:hypothetical protein cyc_02293 [Cyclospora cayetanensis]|uniref:Transmembrane protein n=1 Tax=Cyclospora cayetanensis TaxID=88456 RepID=A0A1D3D5F2_9EIME|nr:hypothetical protein cyc_02293 [Cyclospora cayetanensis]